MSILRINKLFSVLVLLVAVICIIQPVLGSNETVSISYRGSGGCYIGDTVIFDGKNTAGNVTFIRITGPGLPSEGVPIYDLSGNPGSGNPVEVNPDGTWKLAWYTSSIKGIEKMQTARYYFTAADLAKPEISSTTSVLMKKAEFYATLTPNPATLNEYVSVTGSAERGISYVQVDITDITGEIIHSYTSPVSASGYFNYGFHVDMQPGQYSVKVGNPSIKNPLQMTLIIASSRIQDSSNSTGVVNTDNPTVLIPGVATPSPITTQNPSVITAGNGTLSITSIPPGASVYLDSVMMGKTPVNLGNLNYGSHLIEIKSPGYIPYSIQASVQEGAQVTLSPVLVKSPSPIPLSPFTALIGLLFAGTVVLVWRRR
ncbi:MAG: PEGA domain-containing protein [Methanoregula sp.]|nr:PEGA domain-containing protein [Methanoregula sp.]